MMKLKQRILVSTYLRSLKKRLHYPHKSRRVTIKGLRGFIYERILAGDQVNTIQDLYNLFGTPEIASEQWMELISNEENKKYRKEVRIRRAIIISFLVFLLTILILVGWYNHYRSQNELIFEYQGILSESGTLPDTGEEIYT